jgi:hypothetical protein
MPGRKRRRADAGWFLASYRHYGLAPALRASRGRLRQEPKGANSLRDGRQFLKMVKNPHVKHELDVADA